MTSQHKQGLAALVAGVIFSFGLVLGGMTVPANVIGFLDVTGDWRPALMFVMVGAIAVHAVVYRLVVRRRSPVFAERFALPTRRDLDPRLLAGAALFGIGWGLGGYCPGPGITATMSGSGSAFVFVGSMAGAMWLTSVVERARAASKAQQLDAQNAEAQQAEASAEPRPAA